MTRAQTLLDTSFFEDFDPVVTIEQLGWKTCNRVLLEDRESVFLNSGSVRDAVEGHGESDVAVVNISILSLNSNIPNAIELTGSGQRWILNDGYISGDVILGSGADSVTNLDVIVGDVRMAGGDDIFETNNTFGTRHPDVSNKLQGTLFMGSGDDYVENGALIGNVNLGNGNDFYNGLRLNGEISSNGRVAGGRGDDTVFGGDFDDQFYGQGGRDVLNGHGGQDYLLGGGGNDSLRGGNDADTLRGAGDDDLLSGGNGDDRIVGGSGADALLGGHGHDRMTGGPGADRFVFNKRAGNDTITDFSDEDVIVISNTFRGNSETGRFDLPLFTFELLEAFTTYENGHAIIDVGAASVAGTFQSYSSHGNATILLLNVAPGDLTADNFDLGF